MLPRPGVDRRRRRAGRSRPAAGARAGWSGSTPASRSSPSSTTATSPPRSTARCAALRPLTAGPAGRRARLRRRPRPRQAPADGRGRRARRRRARRHRRQPALARTRPRSAPAMLAGALAVPGRRARRGRRGRRPGRRRSRPRSPRREPGDTVLVAGKGHETGQEIAGVVHPFDDRDVLRAAIGACDDRGARDRADASPRSPTIVDGRLVAAPTRDAGRRRHRSSSTRAAVAPGGLFVALAGEHVDGHDYVAAAIARRRGRRARSPAPVDGAARSWSPTASPALAALAARRRRAGCPAPTVVGVTGSSGKTSTKDLLAQVLAAARRRRSRRPARSTTSSGLPLTVLRADAATRYLVLEIGARGIGHIRYLTAIAPPRIGVVLNVGSAHLGEFGSREAIAQAKGELVEALPRADGARRAQRRRPAGARDGRAHPARGSSPFGRARRRRRPRPSDVELDDLGRAVVHARTPAARGAGRAAAARRAPRRQRPGRGGRRARVRHAARPRSRRRSPRRRAASPLADGGHRARRRRDRRQRRLQRQPRVDAGRAADALAAIRAGARRARSVAVLGRDGRARRRRARPSTTRSAGCAVRARHLAASSRSGERPAPIARTAPLWKARGTASRAAVARRRGRARAAARRAARRRRRAGEGVARRRAWNGWPRRSPTTAAPAGRRTDGGAAREDDPDRRASSRCSPRSCAPRWSIVYFRRRGFGQEIRDDGPQTHLTKRGTPTMGGVVIIGSTVVGYLVAHLIVAIRGGGGPTASGLLLLFLMVGLGARRLPRRLHQDPPAAQPRPAGPGQVRRPARRRASSFAHAGAAVPQQARADPGVDAHLLRPRHRRARPRRRSASWSAPT